MIVIFISVLSRHSPARGMVGLGADMGSVFRLGKGDNPRGDAALGWV
jgi:hypothetical protein